MGVLSSSRTLMILCSFILVAFSSSYATGSKVTFINVLDYGAVGDGYIDDSQIYGTLKAPNDTSIWEGLDATIWLAFENVNGLTVSGSGTIDGQGSNWWAQSCRYNNSKDCTKWAPTEIKFISCQNSRLKDLHFINSPNTHILIQYCNMFWVSNLNIASPKTSPNTDGIHIDGSTGVFIDDSIIQSGDDCISIGDHTSNVQINNINCGPGHGVSIGSLGKGGSSAQVENIYVNNVNFSETTNGVRIKTWQGASGYARDITFRQINFNNVQYPIIIDQYYCDHQHPSSCTLYQCSWNDSRSDSTRCFMFDPRLRLCLAILADNLVDS
ncbi:hypothetical protein Scep_021073 [Stephania cephalantha]|uniref:Polygalacturonase n=1 Tax=Stephania cephalantha TaxID=152367 RepID=A0AAP0FCF1_9MAGN